MFALYGHRQHRLGLFRLLSSSTVFAVAIRLTSIAILIAGTKFVAVNLSQEEFGKLALLNVLITLPSLTFFSPLGQGVIRFLPIAKEQGNKQRLLRSYQRLFRLGAGIVAALGGLSVFILIAYGEYSLIVTSLLITLVSVGAAFTTINYGMKNADGKQIESSVLDTGERVLQLSLVVFLLYFLPKEANFVLLAQLLAVSCFTALILLRPSHSGSIGCREATEQDHEQEKSCPIYEKSILRYAWPFIVFGGFGWIQGASERWILEIQCSTTAVAQFAILNQIGFHSQTMLIGAAGYFLTPALFRRAAILSDERMADSNRLNDLFMISIASMSVVGACVGQIAGPWIIRLLADEKYIVAAELLPGIIIAGGIFNVGQIFANRFMISTQTISLILPKVSTGLVGLSFNYAGIVWAGIHGLVLAMVATNLFYCATLVLSWRMRSREFLVQPLPGES